MLIKHFYLDKRVSEIELDEPLPVRKRMCETVDVREQVMGEDFIMETVFKIHEFALCQSIFGEIAYLELTPEEARIT